MTVRCVLIWSSIAVMVLVLGACGPGWIWGAKLKAMDLQPRDLVQTLVVNGRVLASRVVQVGAQQTGIIARRLVGEGDRVEAGQLLLQLESSEYQASLDLAQAGLAQVREVDQPLSRSLLSQADSTLHQAQWVQERNMRLQQEGILSQSQLEDSRKALELAQAARLSAHAQSWSKLSGSGLKLAQASVAVAQAKLAQTQVLSPAKGVVLTRTVEVGDQVQPSKLLFTIALDEPLQLLVQPDERNLSKLQMGQEAQASTDAFPDRRFPARVSYVSPGVDVQRGTVDVRLELPQVPAFLRPDMTVSVEIRYGESKNALAIPLQALRTDTGFHVLVLRDGRAQQVTVKLGQRGEREVEVLRGLKSGDIVLLDPAAKAGSRYRALLQAAP
jgi:HlyD family secretion protein